MVQIVGRTRCWALSDDHPRFFQDKKLAAWSWISAGVLRATPASRMLCGPCAGGGTPKKGWKLTPGLWNPDVPEHLARADCYPRPLSARVFDQLWRNATGSSPTGLRNVTHLRRVSVAKGIGQARNDVSASPIAGPPAIGMSQPEEA